MRRGLISILFCWLLAGPLAAQQTRAEKASFDYIFRNLDNSNGLISNEVTSLVQDEKGFIWIGSEKGLQRYDGLRFVNCTNADSTIKDNMPVYSLYPDTIHNKILYNLSYTHLNQWDILRNKASAVLPEKVFQPGAMLYKDREGGSWWLESYNSRTLPGHPDDREGIVLVKAPVAAGGLKTEMGRPGGPGAPTYYFAAFVRDSLGQELWAWDSYYGLLRFDERSKTVTTLYLDSASNPLLACFKKNPYGVRKMWGDSHGNIWVITWTHVFYRYDIAAQHLYTYSIQDILRQQGSPQTVPGWVSGVLEDNHGVLWLGTAKAGLLQYDFAKDRFLYLLPRPGNNLALQYNHQINALFQDRQENIWVATDRGISFFNPYRQYFTTTGNPGEGGGPGAGTEINAACYTPGGTLLVGNWGGGITVYGAGFKPIKHIFFKGEYNKNLIWSFIQQDDGKIWAGCQRGLLHIIDTSSWSVETISPAGKDSSTIRVMVKDREGNTLLGMHNGKILIWDRRQRKFLPFLGVQPKGPLPGLRLNPVANLFVDREGRCWAGTWDGISEFDLKKRDFIGSTRPPNLSPPHTLGITDYNDSTLIVGMENGGLYFYNKRSRQWQKVPVNVEQPLWSANAIKVDSTGNIWFSTDYEICSYQPASNKFFTCHPERGLLNSSFNSLQMLAIPSGGWLVWSYSELVSFQPAAISALQTRAAGARITGFRVFNDPLFIDSLINNNQPVRLGYKDNFIGIEFSDLQYYGVTQTKYYYRLKGIDKDWVYGGTRGSAGYTNIPPGKYVFQVKTGNQHQDEIVTSLEIIIDAPFWATAWFIAVILLLVAAIIYLLVRMRIQHIQKEGDMRQQMARTEMMALRAQMNPHFIFNCINSIDALIQCNDKYLATVYLNKFAKLIRNILDSSRTNTIALSRDLETLQLYIDLEQFRSEHAFEVEIHTDESLLHEDYKIPPLIIQPYVENAILHGLRSRKGGGGRLRIDISRQGDHLVYRIEDNGVGRDAARNDDGHRSHGMEMSGDRVRLFNREEEDAPAPVIITDLYDNGLPAGTRVEVSLKIQ